MTMTKTHVITLLAIISLVGLTACSTTAPPYLVSIPNVQTLKSSNATGVAVAGFTAQGAEANNDSIRIRGRFMDSAHGDFSKYLQNAVVQELTEARLLDAKSNIVITAVLIKNDISAAGIVSASAEMEARFKVINKGNSIYDKVKRASIEWESSFAADIAIPRARQNYPNLVSELLKQLYADKEFLASLKN